MSNSSSSSSESDNRDRKKESVKTPKLQEDSCSDSDFVDHKKKAVTVKKAVSNPTPKTDKPKHLLHQSTPVVNADFMSSSKLQFQKMLMGSNNKLTELLKNKQKLAEKKVSTTPSPIKGILKSNKANVNPPALDTPTHKSSEKSPKNKSGNYEFSPVASSTQINEISLNTSKWSDHEGKIKRQKKENVSDSDGSNSSILEKSGGKEKQQNETMPDSESSSSSVVSKTNKKEDTSGKTKKKKQLKETVSDSKSSSSSVSEKSNRKKEKHTKGKKETISDSDSSSSYDEERAKEQKSRRAKENDKLKAKQHGRNQKRTTSQSSSDSEDSVRERKHQKKMNHDIKHKQIGKVSKTKQNIKSASSSSEESESDHKEKQEKRKRTSSLTNKAQESSSDSDSSSNISNKNSSARKSYLKFKGKTKQTSSSSESDLEETKQTLKRSKEKTVISKVSSKSIAQLKQFEMEHKSLKKVDERQDFLKNVSLNEEIFLVQIPKNLDPKSLEGTKISLTETTRVPEKSRKYDCVPLCEPQEHIALFNNSEQVQLIKPAGNIKMKRHIKAKHFPDMSGLEGESVPFPDNLKERHPLFGVDYSNKIGLQEHVKQKLKAAIESYAKQMKKKKKKKRKHSEVQDKSIPKGEQEEIFKFLSNTETNESKKHEEFSKVGATIVFEEEQSTSKAKKKKKKDKHLESFRSEMGEDIQLPLDEESTVKKKKHKKHRKADIDEGDLSMTVTLNDKSSRNTKHGKKSKLKETEGNTKDKKEDVNSEDALKLINEMLLSKSREVLQSGAKKKKERKRTHSSRSINEDESDTGIEIQESKKKKHKRKHESYELQ